MQQLVTCVIADGVADVRLNRPDKLNALSPASFVRLGEVLEDASKGSGLIWEFGRTLVKQAVKG